MYVAEDMMGDDGCGKRKVMHAALRSDPIGLYVHCEPVPCCPILHYYAASRAFPVPSPHWAALVDRPWTIQLNIGAAMHHVTDSCHQLVLFLLNLHWSKSIWTLTISSPLTGLE